MLPVEYGRSVDIAIAEYDRLQPGAVIMLGQAGGRSAITPETTAKNLMNSDAPDNAGCIANDKRISGSGPETLNSTLPIDIIIDTVAERGIPCERSDDAGAFVCNDLFYSMLEHNRGEVPTGFIHVPYIEEQGHTDKPYMELEDLQMGVKAVLEAVAYKLWQMSS